MELLKSAKHNADKKKKKKTFVKSNLKIFYITICKRIYLSRRVLQVIHESGRLAQTSWMYVSLAGQTDEPLMRSWMYSFYFTHH